MKNIYILAVFATLSLQTVQSMEAPKSLQEELFDTVAVGKVDDLIKVMAKGPDIHAKSQSGYTLLMWALYNTEYPVEMFNAILEYDVDVNVRDNHGNTVLMLALRKSSGLYKLKNGAWQALCMHQIIRLLLKHNKINLDLVNQKDETARSIAEKLFLPADIAIAFGLEVKKRSRNGFGKKNTLSMVEELRAQTDTHRQMLVTQGYIS